jgi:hypothetical protein
MEFKDFYSLFENETIHRLLAKKKVTPSPMAFAGTSFMALRIPVVSMDFSDLCHQAHYIFWMIIVGVDLPFQVHPKIFIQPYL